MLEDELSSLVMEGDQEGGDVTDMCLQMRDVLHDKKLG